MTELAIPDAISPMSRVPVSEALEHANPSMARLVEANIALRRKIEILEGELAALKDQVTRDPMTGLRHRLYFQERLRREMARCFLIGDYCSVMVLDVDNLKAINDVHGHASGDLVLHRVASILRSVARPSDFVARLGGDEFATALPETEALTARYLAEAILRSVASRPQHSQSLAVPPCPFSVSIGIASSPPVRPDGASLLAWADGAMYLAKARGGGYIQVACGHLFEDGV